MKKSFKNYNVAIIGAGQFGTAIGNCLSASKINNVTLFSNNKNKVRDINNNNKNVDVFPNFILNEKLKATASFKNLITYEVIFLAIPSSKIVEFISLNKTKIKENAVIVNLSKGMVSKELTILDYLQKEMPTCNVVSMKGPTFAIELLKGSNTLFTFAFDDHKNYNLIRNVVDNTNIYLDTSSDLIGVEVLSVLKNIYAILLGYIDAKYNSANTRFLILTKAFGEMRVLLKELGGQEETLDLACGYGDLGLTCLNDLSRNRTLGLLMGKGFYVDNSNNIVLEGLKGLNMISKMIPSKIIERLPLFSRIKESFSNHSGVININFKDLIMQKEKNVITYGTFDLLHYGHLEILSRAKNLGTRLTVGLSTDDFNKEKGKTCVHNYDKRKEFLESLSYVHKVIPENSWNQKINDIKVNNIDLLVMGDDWRGKFDELNEYCEVEYLPRTKGVSTTLLKKNLSESN